MAFWELVAAGVLGGLASAVPKYLLSMAEGPLLRRRRLRQKREECALALFVRASELYAEVSSGSLQNDAIGEAYGLVAGAGALAALLPANRARELLLSAGEFEVALRLNRGRPGETRELTQAYETFHAEVRHVAGFASESETSGELVMLKVEQDLEGAHDEHGELTEKGKALFASRPPLPPPSVVEKMLSPLLWVLAPVYDAGHRRRRNRLIEARARQDRLRQANAAALHNDAPPLHPGDSSTQDRS